MDHLLLPVLLLVATPIFVAQLGVDRFGVWMLVNSLLGFSGLFAFGLSDATIKYVSHYRALGDSRGASRVIQSTLTVYMLLGLVAGIVVTLGAPLLAGRVFQVEAKDAPLLVATLKISGLGIVARMFDSVMQSALQGFERYDLAAAVSMTGNLLTVVLNVLAAIFGYGLEVLILTAIALLVATGVVKMILIKVYLTPDLAIRPCWNREALAEIFSFGIYSWLQGISGILLGQADRLMIASMMGPRQLTYYAVCLQLAQQIHALPSKAAASLFPLASAARAKGDTVLLRDVYFRSMLVVTTVGIALGVPIFMNAKGIMTIWMGSEFALVATPILQILALSFTLMSTSIVPYYYLSGAGYVRLNMIFSVVSGLSVVLAGVALIPVLGILGAAWSRLANLPVSLASRSITHSRVLDDRRWYAPVTSIGPVFLTFGLCWLLTQWIPTTSTRPDLLIACCMIWSLVGLVIGGALTLMMTPTFDHRIWNPVAIFTAPLLKERSTELASPVPR